MTEPRPDSGDAGRPQPPFVVDPVERRLAELGRCLLRLGPSQLCGRAAVLGEGRGLRCALHRDE